MAIRDTLSKLAHTVGDLMSKKPDPENTSTARGLSLPYLQGGGSGAGNPLDEYLFLESDLVARHVDYDSMDEYGDLAIALDLYGQESTQLDTQTSRVMQIKSKDKKVQKVLEHLFDRKLEYDHQLPDIARATAKYGSTFQEVLLYPGEGVVGLHTLPPSTVRRIEDAYGHMYGFVQDVHGRMGITPQTFIKLMAQREKDIEKISQQVAAKQALSEGRDPMMEYILGDIPIETFMYAQQLPDQIPFMPWEIVHYRLMRQLGKSVYGESVLEPARWAWRRLIIMEDITLMYRLQRAPERFAFYVPTGSLPAEESLAVLKKFQAFLRRKSVMNQSTGKLELRNDVISPDEDFFLPVPSEGDGPRVENLGAPQWQSLEELNFFLHRMWSATGVPMAYFSDEMGVSRNSLASDDVHFARKCMRLQQVLMLGARHAAEVELSTHDIDPASDFTLSLTVPSAVYELAQLEVRNARADLAGRMGDFFSLRWILKNVFKIYDDSEIEEIIAQRRDDAIRGMTTDAEGQKQAQKILPQPEFEARQRLATQKPWLFEWSRPGYKLEDRKPGPLRKRPVAGFTSYELDEGSRTLERKWRGREHEIRNAKEFKDRFDRIEVLLHEIRAKGTRR